MARNSWLVVVASALLNGVAIVAGRGSFYHLLAVLGAAIYVGVPALIGFVCSRLVRERVPLARRLAPVAGAVALVSASTLLSLVPGAAVARRDIAAARSYCESLIPAIDEYQRTHGAFPSNIVFVAKDREVPRLLRGVTYYWSDGTEFTINFGDPRGMMNFIGYNSETRRWSEWH